jgi:aminopeptidase
VEAGEIKKWLNSLMPACYHVESEHVDLRVTPGERRRWIGISGHNIPSFELFLSPDWRGVEGVYYADQLSYRSGNYVRGVRLEFRGGEVVASGAGEGGVFVADSWPGQGGLASASSPDRPPASPGSTGSWPIHSLTRISGGGGETATSPWEAPIPHYDGDPAELDASARRLLGSRLGFAWDSGQYGEKAGTAVMPTFRGHRVRGRRFSELTSQRVLFFLKVRDAETAGGMGMGPPWGGSRCVARWCF